MLGLELHCSVKEQPSSGASSVQPHSSLKVTTQLLYRVTAVEPSVDFKLQASRAAPLVPLKTKSIDYQLDWCSSWRFYIVAIYRTCLKIALRLRRPSSSFADLANGTQVIVGSRH